MADRNFPGLTEASKRASKAISVLESAIEHATPREGESLADVALRIRGSAVLAATGALELAAVGGIHEAAHAAGEAGVLDEENDD